VSVVQIAASPSDTSIISTSNPMNESVMITPPRDAPALLAGETTIDVDDYTTPEQPQSLSSRSSGMSCCNSSSDEYTDEFRPLSPISTLRANALSLALSEQQQFEDEMRTAGKYAAHLHAQLKEEQSRHRLLSEKYEKLNAEVQFCQQTCVEVSEQKQALEVEYDRQMQELDACKSENRKLQDRVLVEVELRAKVEAEKGCWREQMDGQVSEIKELKEKLEGEMAMNYELDDELTSRREEVKQLKGDLNSSKKQVEAVQEELTLLQQTCSKKDGAQHELEDKLSLSRSALVTTRQEVDELKERLAAADIQSKNVGAEQVKCEEETTRLREKISNLESELEESRVAFGTTRRELLDVEASHRNTVEKLEQELAECQEELRLCKEAVEQEENQKQQQLGRQSPRSATQSADAESVITGSGHSLDLSSTSFLNGLPFSEPSDGVLNATMGYEAHASDYIMDYMEAAGFGTDDIEYVISPIKEEFSNMSMEEGAQQLERSQSIVQRLLQDGALIRQRLHDTAERGGSLEDENQELKESLDRAMEDLEAEHEEVERLERELEECQGQLTKYRGELESVKTKRNEHVQCLEAEAQASRVLVDELRLELQKSNDKFDSTSKNIIRLEKEVQESKQSFENLSQEHERAKLRSRESSDQFATSETRFKTDLAQKEMTLSRLETELKKTREVRDNQKQELVEANEKLDGLVRDVQRVETEIKTAKRELELSKRTIATQESTINQLDEELMEARDKISLGQRASKHLSSELAAAKKMSELEKNSMLQQQDLVQKLTEDLRCTQGKLKDAMERCDALAGELSAECARSKQDLDECTKEFSQKLIEKDNEIHNQRELSNRKLEDAKSKWQSSKEEDEDVKCRLSETIALLRSEVAATKHEAREELESRLREQGLLRGKAEEKIIELQQQLTAVQASHTTTNEELVHCRASIEVLESEVSELSEKLEGAEDDVVNAGNAHDDLLARLNTEHTRADKLEQELQQELRRSRELHSTLEDMMRNRDEVVQKASALEEQLKTCIQENEKLRNDSCVFEQQWQDGNRQTKELNSQLQVLYDQIQHLTRSFNDATQSRDDAVSKLNEALNHNTKYKQDSAKMKALEDKSTRLRQCVEQLTKKCEDWSASYAKQNAEYRKAKHGQKAAVEKIATFVKQISKLKHELSRTKEAHETDVQYWEEEMKLIKEQVGRFESRVGRVSQNCPPLRNRQRRALRPLSSVEENVTVQRKSASSQTDNGCRDCKYVKTSMVALKEEKKIGEFLGSVSPPLKENVEANEYASPLSKYI